MFNKSFRYVTPPHESYDQLDDIYWSYDMIDRADDPIYGADVPATLIDEDKKIWNVGKDETIFNDFGRRLTRVDVRIIFLSLIDNWGGINIGDKCVKFY